MKRPRIGLYVHYDWVQYNGWQVRWYHEAGACAFGRRFGIYSSDHVYVRLSPISIWHFVGDVYYYYNELS
jgi:hypothetical protein